MNEDLIFTGFASGNFAIFDLENRTYRTGDPIGEEAKERWTEWKQFASSVVNATSKQFDILNTQWQNSGNLSVYHWSALRDKGHENYSTCLGLMITKQRILVNLGYHDRMDKLGKGLDNKHQYNSWIQHCTPESIPQEYWDKLSVWVPDEEPVPLRKFLSDQETKDGLLKRLAENKDLYLDVGRVFDKDEAISLGGDIVKEAAETLNILYPIYWGILQRAQDSMVLIGSSADFSDSLDSYREVISSQGAVMSWWSYIIRDEYQTLLRRNLPVTLYIYGTDQGKRAITHALTVSEFLTSTGNEGLLSPYQDLTLKDDRDLKRSGNTQSQVFKTWLKVTKIEVLTKPLGLDEFVQFDTKGFINPSGMVNSFIYARKISAQEVSKRLTNCLSMTLEHFNLTPKKQQPLEQVLKEQKGFGFDLQLKDDEPSADTQISLLTASRYKHSNKLLFHVTVKCFLDGWQEQLNAKGYKTWLKDGADSNRSFEDNHSFTDYATAVHVKLADIELDSFTPDSFIAPLEGLYNNLSDLGLNLPNWPLAISPREEWLIKTLPEILAAIKDSEMIFSEDTVINLHNCLNALPEKHFLILTGISGTGKTKFAQIYANALYGLPPEDRNNPFFSVIPVQPQWSDRTGLLGYFNPLTEKYHRPMFLEHLLKAVNDPKHMYYVCLDEMNLAVVEYYFADLLSAMESNHKIQLHISETSIDGVPPFLEVPANFNIFGTVNVDETTHQFSNKVLDRAYTIEFNEVDLEAYQVTYLRKLNSEHHDLVKEVGVFCQRINEELAKHNMHFAYRTIKEIFAYIVFNAASSNRLSNSAALDNMVMQKILPKIRGDEKLIPMLEKVRDLVKEQLEKDNYSPRQRSLTK